MKDPRNNTNPNQDLYDMAFKRTLCLDFDGVFHLYSQGWKGPTEIYDGVVPGSIDWLEAIAAHTNEEGEKAFDPQIYSSRSKHAGGIAAMEKWFIKHGLSTDTLCLLVFPTEKPAAWLTIDDRCFQFRGLFPTPDFLINYKAWMKRPVMAEGVAGDADLLRRIASDYQETAGDVHARLLRIANELEGRTESDNSVYHKVG